MKQQKNEGDNKTIVLQRTENIVQARKNLPNLSIEVTVEIIWFLMLLFFNTPQYMEDFDVCNSMKIYKRPLFFITYPIMGREGHFFSQDCGGNASVRDQVMTRQDYEKVNMLRLDFLVRVLHKFRQF